MKLPRQIIFSSKNDELTNEEKVKMLNRAAAGGLVLGGMGAISSLSYLTNYLPKNGGVKHVKPAALKIGIPVLIGGTSLAAWAKHKKDKLQKEKDEDKKRKGSK